MALYSYKLETDSPNDALCQVLLKLAHWFWGRFFYFVNILLPFCYYLPLEKNVGLYLNKPESTPSKDALCLVWLKFAHWFSRGRCCDYNVFKLFHYYLHIEKGSGPSLEKTWNYFTQGCFVTSLAELDPVVLEKMKMWKVYRQTGGQTTELRQAIRKAKLSFQLRWAKKHWLSVKIRLYKIA